MNSTKLFIIIIIRENDIRVLGSETDAIVFLHFLWELSSFGEFFETSLLVTNAARTVLDARIAFLVVDALEMRRQGTKYIAATADDDGVKLKRVDGGKLVADFADEAFVLAGLRTIVRIGEISNTSQVCVMWMAYLSTMDWSQVFKTPL